MSSSAGGFLGRSSTSNSNMRGLVQFIADLRNARARELEEKRINKELANIRQKFKDGNLNGYHKKKYVCKLLYIYILGWNVDFGHLEAVNLISANKYSEKQIGYLAMTLFLHEKHELLHLVVNSIRKDLLDHNELFNCLALHAIANIGSREMGEALSGEVHRLLISPTSKSFVKKKAALTLLRLYRKFPDVMQPQWTERIISLLDDVDLGVALSVTSLVMALAQDNQEQYKGAYVKGAARLKRIVVDGEYTVDYLYYKVPCPWIQIKLLRLLQYFPPSEDSHVREMIRESLQKILNQAMETNKNVQQNNAQNAVLFEAINLIIHLDTEQALMQQISTRLGKFIQSRETNVRYLGLEAMTHLAARTDTLDPIKQHQDIIVGSLRDRDISVRRKGLDLLYSMCDGTNAQQIVGELLHYLQNADFAIREEMVLKIAILTEKYAADVQWYVDITLRLIAMAGDHVSDEVWQRVTQIVTNNEELQVYAAKNSLMYVKQDHCHETLVRIGAYILGEFGHLIAEERGCSPIEQFLALHGKVPACSAGTRAMILSCFVKFVNLFPEIKPQLVQVFEVFSHALDSELQQRACEYLALVNRQTDDLLRTVLDEMPPFPERQSALLSRLHQKHANTSDKRTWVLGGKDANTDSTELGMVKNPGLKRAFSVNEQGGNGGSLSSNGTGNGTSNGNATASSGNGAGSGNSNGNSTQQQQHKAAHDLMGIDMQAMPITAAKVPNLASAAHLSPGWERGYNRLLLRADGILFEDGQLQVGVRSEYRGQMACLILYFSNKTPATVTSFTTTLDLDASEKGRLTWDVKTMADASIGSSAQTQQVVMFEARRVFEKSPTIRISYLAGALQAITLKLPLTAHKFMDPTQLTGDDFFKRWKQIGGAPREAQQIFGLEGGGGGGQRELTASFIRKTLEGFRWGLLDNVDPNQKNFVGASVVHTSEGGKFGCLMRLEPNYTTQMIRFTIRATDESVPPVMLKLMQSRLAQGVSPYTESARQPTQRDISDMFGNVLVSPDDSR
ncbi:ap-2 complex subunit alpha [Grosmannia clavigera kw1407]|uniref:AP-2 complex subunit alpha n=1 Tax=Grosmannia clavigera (strain kw1407 / UAMH 11150) TaxID=655863 RepID=F0XD38_GROCL|nr:ap-2 complex subunit alpha [Grosmannia clavigera kw1407]EFX04216.1 ap-2 complex subunit alpha [Grosmannia clavigera kw1407]